MQGGMAVPMVQAPPIPQVSPVPASQSVHIPQVDLPAVIGSSGFREGLAESIDSRTKEMASELGAGIKAIRAIPALGHPKKIKLYEEIKEAIVKNDIEGIKKGASQIAAQYEPSGVLENVIDVLSRFGMRRRAKEMADVTIKQLTEEARQSYPTVGDVRATPAWPYLQPSLTPDRAPSLYKETYDPSGTQPLPRKPSQIIPPQEAQGDVQDTVTPSPVLSPDVNIRRAPIAESKGLANSFFPAPSGTLGTPIPLDLTEAQVGSVKQELDPTKEMPYEAYRWYETMREKPEFMSSMNRAMAAGGAPGKEAQEALIKQQAFLQYAQSLGIPIDKADALGKFTTFLGGTDKTAPLGSSEYSQEQSKARKLLVEANWHDSKIRDEALRVNQEVAKAEKELTYMDDVQQAELAIKRATPQHLLNLDQNRADAAKFQAERAQFMVQTLNVLMDKFDLNLQDHQLRAGELLVRVLLTARDLVKLNPEAERDTLNIALDKIRAGVTLDDPRYKGLEAVVDTVRKSLGGRLHGDVKESAAPEIERKAQPLEVIPPTLPGRVPTVRPKAGAQTERRKPRMSEAVKKWLEKHPEWLEEPAWDQPKK